MTLRDFKDLLSAHPTLPFHLLLPGGGSVPVSFHITEIGLVKKTFLDCGGRLHETATCQLQIWVGPDDDHRLATGKMSGILAKASSFLPDDSVPVELEYEDLLISQYPVESWEVTPAAVVLRLTTKHTDCLAKDICLPPGLADASGSCCSGSSCCAPAPRRAAPLLNLIPS